MEERAPLNRSHGPLDGCSSGKHKQHKRIPTSEFCCPLQFGDFKTVLFYMQTDWQCSPSVGCGHSVRDIKGKAPHTDSIPRMVAAGTMTSLA
jgi:hypothetical protein